MTAWRRSLGVLGALLLALGVAGGCARRADPNARSALRGAASVLIGSDGQERLSGAVIAEQKELVRLLKDDFQTLQPAVRLHLTLEREEDIPQELAARHRDGLAPDLLLVYGTTARELMRQGLSRPVPLNPELNRLLRPHLRQRIAHGQRELVGVPMLIEPQLACFNRRRLPQSPPTLAALEDASERGIEVGIPISTLDLYWTVGAMGANGALTRAIQGQRLNATQHQAVLAWLSWLRDANMRQRVNFFTDQESLLQGLISGQLDWISCRSTNLGRLRKVLGQRLGVATLPRGSGGPPTPLLRYRVWVFGPDSSPEQQRIAETFVRLSLTPVMQRFLTLHTQEMLPASREVSTPTGDSPVLQAMVRSEQQSRAADGISNRLRSGEQRLQQINALLLELIFNERSPERTQPELIRLLGAMS